MRPPDDVEPGELWRRLEAEEPPTEVVDFPRKGRDGKPKGRVRLKVLRQEDHGLCAMEARKRLREMPLFDEKDIAADAMLQIEAGLRACEVLARACMVEKPTVVKGTELYGQAFPSPDWIWKNLTADEINTLMHHYNQVQHKFGPLETLIATPEDLDAWVKRLAEAKSTYPLGLLGSLQSEDLTLSLAQRLWSMCQLLDSQWSSLPDTLKSALETLSFATGYYGAPQDEPSPSTSSVGFGLPTDRDLTMEEATKALEESKKSQR